MPIYVGGGTIKEVVPTNSVIVARDFSSAEDLARHLAQVARNETKYNEYLEWRKRPLERRLVEQYEQNLDPRNSHERHCKFCRLVHERPHGKVPADDSCVWWTFKTKYAPIFNVHEENLVVTHQNVIDHVPQKIPQK